MRSVFVFTNASPDAIGAVLDGVGERAGTEWIGTSVVAARIEEPPNWSDGWQDIDRALLEQACNGKPARLVVADISGRIDGSRVAQQLAAELRALGPAAIFDDYSEDPWTDAELQAGVDPAGRRLLHPK